MYFCPKLVMNTDLGIFSLCVCKNYLPNNNVLIQLESLSFKYWVWIYMFLFVFFCNTVTVRHYAFLKQWFDPLYFWANFWSLQDMSDWMLTTLIRFSASALCHLNEVLFYCKDAFLQSHMYYFLAQPLVAGWDQLHDFWAEP